MPGPPQPSGNPLNLRRPWDRSLADCMWLARFLDKTRLHRRGELPPDFASLYGHPLATDGCFLRHFRLELTAVTTAASSDDSDTALTRWFLAQPGVTPATIAAWNDLAPHLGQPGTPMARAFRFARRQYYGGADADPRVTTVFAGIAWDEDCLAELPAPPAP